MQLTDPLATLRQGLENKECTARELLAASRQAIAARDGTVHAFLHIAGSEAEEAAAAVDARRDAGESLPPLAGMPIAVKDVIVTKEWPTTAGSRILEGYRSPYTATVIELLKKQQAIIVGKTNCDEFAMGSSGEYSAYGPTRNPWDPKRVPGGSSSGSAAAVAAGMCVAALGSDTGGSVREPASFCNLTGIKPTYGRVSRYGLIALASSLDHIGVLARTAEDAAVLLSAVSGFDERDATSARLPIPNYAADLVRARDRWRIGIPRAFLEQGLGTDVAALFAEVEKTFQALSSTVTDVALAHAHVSLPVYYVILPAEASANLARYDGIRFGPALEAAGGNFRDRVSAYRAAHFGDEVKRRLMLGVFASSMGYQDQFYRRATRVRELIRREFMKTLTDVDAILLPTTPDVAFPLGEKSADPLALYLSDLYTVAANITGLPAISFPAGFVRGLPFGAQLIGRPFGESDLLRMVHAYQQVTDWHTRRPPLP